MFTKILIANRGEIACRVIRTARSMGIGTVAVFSDADRDALHVVCADEAMHIGGARPSESYLRGDRVIEAARAAGADAIHPGYGFLSENPDFVTDVEAAGLTFIGPAAAAIRAMGLKGAAKRLMAEAGVPVVPGYHDEDQEPGRLEVEADRIGYPVMIKAVAGGGGKGMRRVDHADDFIEALESAKREALGAFGSDAVILERFIRKPRHIEVQVFGDGTRALHLFERDCSLQRRHQKVIEEAPAPGMSDAMRRAMGDAAVRAAEAIGYSGAGTVEFIVDASDGLSPDRFWFMEMNTRLQVEHPVTEAITGIDLVEWQLRVAAGEGLPAVQADLSISGHAMEARIYAEDVPNGFLPATGTLSHLAFPASARIDSGVRAGDSISPHYDPMIAKVVVHGPTRAAALGKLRDALRDTRIAGSVTNLSFLTRLAAMPDFVAGRPDTGLIDRNLAELAPDPEPCVRTHALAALAALGLHAESADPLAGFALWVPLRQRAVFLRGGQMIEAIVEPLGSGAYDVSLDGGTFRISRKTGAWWIDGQKTTAELACFDTGISVFWGNAYHFDRVDPLMRGESNGTGDGTVTAPMPGQVKSVLVTAGEAVAAGQSLAVLEAMKMEHTLKAPRDATVAQVLAAAGDQVEAGQALVLFEDETEGRGS